MTAVRPHPKNLSSFHSYLFYSTHNRSFVTETRIPLTLDQKHRHEQACSHRMFQKAVPKLLPHITTSLAVGKTQMRAEKETYRKALQPTRQHKVASRLVNPGWLLMYGKHSFPCRQEMRLEARHRKTRLRDLKRRTCNGTMYTWLLRHCDPAQIRPQPCCWQGYEWDCRSGTLLSLYGGANTASAAFTKMHS